MEKPPLKSEQKEIFDTKFQKLIDQSPQSVKNLWGNRKPDYSSGEPNTYGIETKLTGELANAYSILYNKALSRTL